LDSQEDFLIKENKKHVKVKNAYALEVEKCEKLSSELSTCHDIIANLKNENDRLIPKVDSNVADDSISNLRDDNIKLLAKIEELNVSLASLRNDNEKLIAKAKDLRHVWIAASLATLCLTFLPKVSSSIRTTNLRQSVA
jgi:predicted RNase H-like nuclease (RuvC/YqgF family)